MPTRGRAEGKFFDPEGRDLPFEEIQEVKSIQCGDIMTFDPINRVVVVWRIENQRRRCLFTRWLPVIDRKETFRMFAEHVRNLAMLERLEEMASVPEPFWAFRFI